MIKFFKNLISRRCHRSQKQIFLKPQHTLSIHLFEHLLGINLRNSILTPNLAVVTVINQKQLEYRTQAAFRNKQS